MLIKNELFFDDFTKILVIITNLNQHDYENFLYKNPVIILIFYLQSHFGLLDHHTSSHSLQFE